MAYKNIPHSALRNTFTVAAILGFGVVTGALLAETSLMNFRLARPTALLPRAGGTGQINGYLAPTNSPGMSRRAYTQRRRPMPHHTGL